MSLINLALESDLHDFVLWILVVMLNDALGNFEPLVQGLSVSQVMQIVR